MSVPQKITLLAPTEVLPDDLDRHKIAEALESSDDSVVLAQIESLISWTYNDGLLAKLTTFRLAPALLKLLNHPSEAIVDKAATAMSYLSGRTSAGPYCRQWSFSIEWAGSTSSTTLYINEPAYSSGAGLGWKTWNAALVLVEFLGLHPSAFVGHDILELGCGTGLSGIFCAKFGAISVEMTDYNEKVLETVRENLIRNDVTNVTPKRMDWLELISNSDSNQGDSASYDTIIGSDIVYDPEHAEIVPKVLDILLSHAPHARVYIAIGPRPEATRFMKLMREVHHFEEEIHLEPHFVDAEGKSFHHDLLVYKRSLV